MKFLMKESMLKFFLHMDTMSNFWLQNINIMRQVGGMRRLGRMGGLGGMRGLGGYFIFLIISELCVFCLKNFVKKLHNRLFCRNYAPKIKIY